MTIINHEYYVSFEVAKLLKEAAEIAYNAGQTEEEKSFLYSEGIY